MKRAVSRRLVVDASVVRAAGSASATDATSKACRDVLIAILRICHRVVLTAAIRAEWRRHQSLFASQWMTSMYAKKKVVGIDAGADSAARALLARHAKVPSQAAAMDKDYHLIEAALAADGIVLSGDETVRGLFAGVAAHVPNLGAIVWHNPARDPGGLEWLEKGAPAEPGRRLGGMGKQRRSRS